MAEMVKKIQRSRQAATVSFPGIRLVNKSEAFNRFFFDHFETEAMAQSHSDFDLILRNLSEKYKSLSAVESKVRQDLPHVAPTFIIIRFRFTA